MRKKELIENINQLLTRLSKVENKLKYFEFLEENKNGYKVEYSKDTKTESKFTCKIDEANNIVGFGSLTPIDLYFYYISPITHIIKRLKLRTDYFESPLTYVHEVRADINKINDFTYIVKIGEIYYLVDIRHEKVREIYSEYIDNILSI